MLRRLRRGRAGVEQRRVDGVDIVEPGAHLADVLHDVIARETLLEFLLILERIMVLGERHRAAFKPAVEYFVDTRKLFAVDFKSDVVDPRTVVIFELYPAEFFQLGVAADDFHCAFVTLPHWHGRRPETIAAQVPVGCLLDVLSKPAVLEMWREPVDIFVLLEHQWL